MFNFGAPSPFVYRKRTPKNDRASVAKLKQVCVGLTGSETLACSLPGPLAVRPSILQLPATLDDQLRLKLNRCCISGARRLSPDACNRTTPAGWCINKWVPMFLFGCSAGAVLMSLHCMVSLLHFAMHYLCLIVCDRRA